MPAAPLFSVDRNEINIQNNIHKQQDNWAYIAQFKQLMDMIARLLSLFTLDYKRVYLRYTPSPPFEQRQSIYFVFVYVVLMCASS